MAINQNLIQAILAKDLNAVHVEINNALSIDLKAIIQKSELARYPELAELCYSSTTYLHLAAAVSSQEIVAALHAKGADIYATVPGSEQGHHLSAFDLASLSAKADPKTAEFLLKLSDQAKIKNYDIQLGRLQHNLSRHTADLADNERELNRVTSQLRDLQVEKSLWQLAQSQPDGNRRSYGTLADQEETSEPTSSKEYKPNQRPNQTNETEKPSIAESQLLAILQDLQIRVKQQEVELERQKKEIEENKENEKRIHGPLREIQLESDENLQAFYMRFRSRAAAFFQAYRLAETGLFKIDQLAEVGYVWSALDIVGAVVPLPGIAVVMGLIKAGGNYAIDKMQESAMKMMAKVLLLPDEEMQYVINTTAYDLGQTFSTQIKFKLSTSGAQKLADCALWRIICSINDGLIYSVAAKALPEQFKCAVVELVPSLVIGKPQKISTQNGANNWTDEGLFQCSGIKTPAQPVEYFLSVESQVWIYGYRLGTPEEAARLNLVKVVAPSDPEKFLSVAPDEYQPYSASAHAANHNVNFWQAGVKKVKDNLVLLGNITPPQDYKTQKNRCTIL